ncbi:hypothetical protein CO670_25395 [Rhizobium sp. J15]|uniref:beta family protein n=1 Tax=Rhizobium sp. J15 TaxID=2035450 RepID=UPI000BE8D6FD|nr:hypothetical protein [Rhizobium sp. J15]PDT13962.1 hypothetical protein CO670_25395 [Rhizobium sp. J15]
MSRKYVPVLKTTDSELRALKFLTSEIKSHILPAFELTRSRKTKGLPDGSATRRMEQVIEVYGRNNFILDLSTESDLINEEIISFFDQDDGYRNWINFLSGYAEYPIIPCALYEEDGTKADFCAQVSSLVSSFGKICIRGGATDAILIRQLMIWALEATSPDNIIVGGSIYFIPRGMLPNYEAIASQFIQDTVGNYAPHTLFVSSSAYPKYVVDTGYGTDSAGAFDATEFALTDNLVRRFPNLNIAHSDYASVHPIRYATNARGWVPRVDAITDRYSFRRYREADGGYARAAREIYSASGTSLVECWGTDQIRNAALNGRLGGRSPSFWISVRINQWISRAVSR